MEILEGTYLSNTRGFGFVRVEGREEDIFISKENSKKAMDGDIVKVRILDKKHGSHEEGQITKIMQRNTTQIVGTFKKSRNFGFVIPDDKKINGDIFISKSNWKNAKTDQKVVVEITKYPDKKKKAEGKIREVLGFGDETGVDMLSIIRQFKLPYEFPKSVIKEAKEVSKEPVKIDGRLDLRDKEIFTVDGEDAKDLDDAICVDENGDGTYTLGVHIADVSHYVKSGSELDKEAITRGTSVYMLDRVIPMLPKELSNGACSLNHGEDRYAISVFMTIDKDGNVIDSDIHKSVINVTERMNYHNVSDIIKYYNKENEKSPKSHKDEVLYTSIDEVKKYEKYANHFIRMYTLAEILKERRKKAGYLSLDIPESKITLDKTGKPIDIQAYETTIANDIIEQFMLTANETIAERFFWLNAPFIYRVHDKPSEEKITELNKYLYNFGYKIKGKKDDVKPKAFEQILEEIKGTEQERVIANLLLRTLKVARYEAENRGHFGIASKYYCHFTSPIRRYPDLFIHRIISIYLEEDYNVTDHFKEKFETRAIKYAERSSECEQIATKAERESKAMKKAEFMQERVGKQYEGIISSVTNFGMFVELSNTVEGLIRFESLDDDYYIYDEGRKELVGKHSGKIYKLGDKVRIEVVAADKETRKIDFKIASKKEGKKYGAKKEK